MPPDLLDRTLIISTNPYTPEEIQKIIRIRYTLRSLPPSPSLNKHTKLTRTLAFSGFRKKMSR